MHFVKQLAEYFIWRKGSNVGNQKENRPINFKALILDLGC
jgi:hypothetical protein